MPRRDLLWKGIIEDLFEHFLHFFFPDFVPQVDFSKGFQFLDKELEQLHPDSESRHRYADKLIQVHLLSDVVQWVLIHVEVQGYVDPEFPARLFQYYYRIRDRYARPVTTLAILTDENAGFHPTDFQERFLGTEIRFRFNTYKLMKTSLGVLERSNNPFAVIMEIALLALSKKGQAEEEQLASQLEIGRKLRNRAYQKRVLISILNFLRYYKGFEKEENRSNFEEQIAEIFKNRKPMGLEELLLKNAEEQGVEKGVEQGQEKTERKVIANGLRKGLSAELMAELTGLSVEKVRRIIADLQSSQ